MRTMILLIVLFGPFPGWLSTVGIIWYVLSCAKYWYKVHKTKDTALIMIT